MISVLQVIDTQVKDIVHEINEFNYQTEGFIEVVFDNFDDGIAQELQKASFGLKAMYEVIKHKIVTMETIFDACMGRGFASPNDEIKQKFNSAKQAFDIGYKNFFVANKKLLTSGGMK